MSMPTFIALLCAIEAIGLAALVLIVTAPWGE